MIRNVYIIDRRISGTYDFLQDLQPDSAYHFLDADRDGVPAILDIVSSYTELSSLHLISHGAEGVLYLGNTALSAANLPGYEDMLAAVGTHLSPGADLLIYGCNVASGPVGQAFITQLAQATGADVAASTDATGGAGAGANDVLEASIGAIEAATLPLADLVGTLGVVPTVTPFQGSSAQAPILSGTAVVGSGQALKVIVADQAYTTANGVVLGENGSWTLALPAALTAGTHDVKVIVSDLPALPAVAEISGTDAADTALTGVSGSTNRISGGGGDDLITGKSRADMAVYSGNQADYTVSRSGSSVIVKDNRSGSPDGTDTLKGINLLKFADRTVFLEAAANRVFLAGGEQTHQLTNNAVVMGSGDVEHFVVTPSVSSTVYASNGDVVDLARAIDDYQFSASGTKLQISDGTYLTVVNLGGTVTLRTASGATTARIDYANGGKVVLGDDQVVGSGEFNPLKAITNASDRSANAQVQVSDQTTAEIVVVDSDTLGPLFNSGATANAAENQNLLYVAQATDASGPVTYSLSGTDKDLLDIAADGKVTLKTGNLDHEGQASYSFTVVARDGVGNVASKAVVVSVTDGVESGADTYGLAQPAAITTPVQALQDFYQDVGTLELSAHGTNYLSTARSSSTQAVTVIDTANGALLGLGTYGAGRLAVVGSDDLVRIGMGADPAQGGIARGLFNLMSWLANDTRAVGEQDTLHVLSIAGPGANSAIHANQSLFWEYLNDETGYTDLMSSTTGAGQQAADYASSLAAARYSEALMPDGHWARNYGVVVLRGDAQASEVQLVRQWMSMTGGGVLIDNDPRFTTSAAITALMAEVGLSSHSGPDLTAGNYTPTALDPRLETLVRSELSGLSSPSAGSSGHPVHVSEDLQLPGEILGGTVAWVSSNPTVIGNDGRLHGEGAATLTATVSFANGSTQTQTFEYNAFQVTAGTGLSLRIIDAASINAADTDIGAFLNADLLTRSTPLHSSAVPNVSWTNANVYPAGATTSTDALWLYTGFLLPTESGTHQLRITADDSARFYLSGAGVDASQGAAWWGAGTKSVNLVAGQEYKLWVFFKPSPGGGANNIDLSWTTPGSSTFATIPASALALPPDGLLSSNAAYPADWLPFGSATATTAGTLSSTVIIDQDALTALYGNEAPAVTAQTFDFSEKNMYFDAENLVLTDAVAARAKTLSIKLFAGTGSARNIELVNYRLDGVTDGATLAAKVEAALNAANGSDGAAAIEVSYDAARHVLQIVDGEGRTVSNFVLATAADLTPTVLSGPPVVVQAGNEASATPSIASIKFEGDALAATRLAISLDSTQDAQDVALVDLAHVALGFAGMDTYARYLQDSILARGETHVTVAWDAANKDLVFTDSLGRTFTNIELYTTSKYVPLVAYGEDANTANGTTTAVLGTLGGQVQATDVNGDSLAYTLLEGTKFGTVTLDGATGKWTYAPTASGDFHGWDQFTVSVSDGKGGISAPIAIRISDQGAPQVAMPVVRTFTVEDPDYIEPAEKGLAVPGDFVFQDVFIAQTHVQRPDDPYLQLVGDRYALLKVNATSASGAAAPDLVATVTGKDGQVLGSLRLTGPDQLPTSVDLPSLTNLGTQSHSNSYEAPLPSAWIQPGITISVTAGSGSSVQALSTFSPEVGADATLTVRDLGLSMFEANQGAYITGLGSWGQEAMAKLPVQSLKLYEYPLIKMDSYGKEQAGNWGVWTGNTSGLPGTDPVFGGGFQSDISFAIHLAGSLKAANFVGTGSGSTMAYVGFSPTAGGGLGGGSIGGGDATAGILWHEFAGHGEGRGHAASDSNYPYNGITIEGLQQGGWLGPNWGYDQVTGTYLPNYTVKANGTISLQTDPMAGGGGQQPAGYVFQQFSDYYNFGNYQYIAGQTQWVSDPSGNAVDGGFAGDGYFKSWNADTQQWVVWTRDNYAEQAGYWRVPEADLPHKADQRVYWLSMNIVDEHGAAARPGVTYADNLQVLPVRTVGDLSVPFHDILTGEGRALDSNSRNGDYVIRITYATANGLITDNLIIPANYGLQYTGFNVADKGELVRVDIVEAENASVSAYLQDKVVSSYVNSNALANTVFKGDPHFNAEDASVVLPQYWNGGKITWSTTVPGLVDLETGVIDPARLTADSAIRAEWVENGHLHTETFLLKLPDTVYTMHHLFGGVSDQAHPEAPQIALSDLALPSTLEGGRVTWSSSDQGVIDDSGHLLATGSATMTATVTWDNGRVQTFSEKFNAVRLTPADMGGMQLRVYSTAGLPSYADSNESLTASTIDQYLIDSVLGSTPLYSASGALPDIAVKNDGNGTGSAPGFSLGGVTYRPNLTPASDPQINNVSANMVDSLWAYAGYYVAPTTGAYTFAFSADQAGRAYMTVAGQTVQIDSWIHHINDNTCTVNLVAGQIVPMWVFFKGQTPDGYWGDWVSLKVRLPGESVYSVIPGSALAPMTDAQALPFAPTGSSPLTLADTTLGDQVTFQALDDHAPTQLTQAWNISAQSDDISVVSGSQFEHSFTVPTEWTGTHMQHWIKLVVRNADGTTREITPDESWVITTATTAAGSMLSIKGTVDSTPDLDVVALRVYSDDNLLDGTAPAVLNVPVNGALHGPAISSGSSASFAENGTGAAYAAVATAHAGGAISFSLSGVDAAQFDIDAVTGVVTFRTTPNHEAPTDVGADNVYNFIVTATETGNTSVSKQAVALTVTDVADTATFVATELKASDGSAVGLTEAEAISLYLVNQARHAPQVWADMLGVTLNQDYQGNTLTDAEVAAKDSLVFDGELIMAARGHSAHMLATDQFAHGGIGDGTPDTRATAAGYDWASVGENINWAEGTSLAAENVAKESVYGLFIDDGIAGAGHRTNLLGADFADIGIGYAIDEATPKYFGTENPGSNPTEAPHLTGFVLRNSDGNYQYNGGEGLSGVTITIVDTTASKTYTTTTIEQGYWHFAAIAGHAYTVSASGGDFTGTGTATNVVLASGGSNGANSRSIDFFSGTNWGRVDYAVEGNHVATGQVAIAGSATPGGTLTVDTSALQDLDGKGNLSYQWYVDGEALSDIFGNGSVSSSSASLVLNDKLAANVFWTTAKKAGDLAGQMFTVKVTYTDQKGALEAVSGNNSVTVAAAVADTTAPTVTSITHDTNDGNLALGETLTLTVVLSEAVAVTGTPTIALANGGIASYTGGTGTPTLTFSYTPAAGQNSADLVTAASNALVGTIKDLAGNAVVAAGFNNVNPAGTLAVDVSAPTLALSTPADNATAVAVGSDIVLNFSENVALGNSGTIRLYQADNTLVETFDVSGSLTGKVTVSGTGVTLNPSADLANGTAYYLKIDSGAIKDGAGNAYTGIGSATALNFTTVLAQDSTVPTLVSSTPADNATAVAVGSDIVLNFSENVALGSSGTIKLYQANGTLVETFDVSGSLAGKVTVAGTGVTLNPTALLASETGYYVTIDSGAIRDLAGNAHAGISDASTLNFTSGVAAAPSFVATAFDPSELSAMSLFYANELRTAPELASRTIGTSLGGVKYDAMVLNQGLNDLAAYNADNLTLSGNGTGFGCNGYGSNVGLAIEMLTKIPKLYLKDSTDIGFGFKFNAVGDFYTTQNYGTQTSTPHLTGFVLNDANVDRQFSDGEGMAGVRIDIVDQTTGEAWYTTTQSAGYWDFAATTGHTYTVKASGGGFVGTGVAENVVIDVGGSNGNNSRAVNFFNGSAGGSVDYAAVNEPTPAGSLSMAGVAEFGRTLTANFDLSTLPVAADQVKFQWIVDGKAFMDVPLTEGQTSTSLTLDLHAMDSIKGLVGGDAVHRATQMAGHTISAQFLYADQDGVARLVRASNDLGPVVESTVDQALAHLTDPDYAELSINDTGANILRLAEILLDPATDFGPYTKIKEFHISDTPTMSVTEAILVLKAGELKVRPVNDCFQPQHVLSPGSSIHIEDTIEHLVVADGSTLANRLAAYQDWFFNGYPGAYVLDQWTSRITITGGTVSYSDLADLLGGGYGPVTLKEGATLTLTGSSSTLTATEMTGINTLLGIFDLGSAAVSVDGDQIMLTYPKELSGTTALPESFTVNVKDSWHIKTIPVSVTGVAVDGKTVVLTLDRHLTNGDLVTVSYADPGSGNDTNAIQDAAGADAASFTARSAATGNIAINAEVSGTSAAETFTGTSGNDQIYAGGGADTLDGGDGNDILDAGLYPYNGDAIDESTGNLVHGGNGDDEIFGGHGDDQLHGDAGNDLIYAADGADLLYGGDGNDILYGSSGNDVLVGGQGRDTLVGGNGSNTFVFDSALSASGNVDTINDFVSAEDHIQLVQSVFSALSVGALSADQFHAGSAAQDADDRILYDAATGTLSYDADGNGSGAAVQFATLANKPALTAADLAVIGTPTLQGVTTIAGGNAVTLSFSQALGLNLPAVATFDVVIDGAHLTPTQLAVNGSELTLTLGQTINAGQTITVAYAAPVDASAAAIQDFLGVQVASFTATPVAYLGDVTPPTLVSAETSTDGTKIILTYDETLSGVTASPQDFDLLVIDAGDNFLMGRQVSQVYINGNTLELLLDRPIANGRNTVGVAYMDPTAGNDAAAIQDSAGNDAADFSDGIEVTNKVTKLAPVYGTSAAETFNGTAGNDEIYANTGSDTLNGGDGNDILDAGYWGSEAHSAKLSDSSVNDVHGGNGDDEIYGRNGADQLWGDAGDDLIYGSSGNDTIYGGAGNDYLSGGNGNNTFVFDTALSAATNVDTIDDFWSNFDGGADKISLDHAVFSTLSAGALTAAQFHVGTVAQDVDDRIVYDSDLGQLFYDADGSGAGIAVQFAQLVDRPTLSALDFAVL